MAGFQVFPAGTLARGDIQGFLMAQTVMRFADAADRDASLTGNLEDGMMCYLETNGGYYWYDSGLTDPLSGDGGWRPWQTPWTAYTPTWSNFTIGSAQVDCALRWEAGSLRAAGQLYFAADTSIPGTGPVLQTVPLGLTGNGYGSAGAGVYNDQAVNVGVAPLISHLPPNSTNISFSAPGGLIASPTVPHTWTTGDVMTWDILIKVAQTPAAP